MCLHDQNRLCQNFSCQLSLFDCACKLTYIVVGSLSFAPATPVNATTRTHVLAIAESYHQNQPLGPQFAVQRPSDFVRKKKQLETKQEHRCHLIIFLSTAKETKRNLFCFSQLAAIGSPPPVSTINRSQSPAPWPSSCRGVYTRHMQLWRRLESRGYLNFPTTFWNIDICQMALLLYSDREWTFSTRQPLCSQCETACCCSVECSMFSRSCTGVSWKPSCHTEHRLRLFLHL